MYNCPEELKISLAAARVNVELTQDDVAKELGVSKATVIAWEKGRSYPNIAQADKLYSLYKRPVDSIIFLR